MMKIAVDYTEDAPHDHLIKNSVLQMCLSIINYLGWRGDSQPRQSWGKLSMLALNLRNIVIMITLSSNTININKSTMTPLDEPGKSNPSLRTSRISTKYCHLIDVVNALAGCVKWSTDLLCWLCDSLFCLFDDPEFMKLIKQPQLTHLTQYLHSKNEIALHLVLCSATRGLLSAVCRRITLLDSFSTRAISWYENREKSAPNATQPSSSHQGLYAAYQRIRLYTSSSLIKADEFDKLLTSLGADIRSAYNTSLAVLATNNHAPTQDTISRGRQHCELQMLVLQAPPMSFAPVIERFFNKDIREFRQHSEVAKLYFADYSLLEVIDGPRTLEKRRRSGVRVDLFKRVEISRRSSSDGRAVKKSQLPWRACARCGSVMEDLSMVTGSKQPGLAFLLRQQFVCCCGGRMALLPQEGGATHA